MMQPDAYEFFDWSPHDIKHMLFGSRIIEPDEPDPYTQDELEKMKEDLLGTSVEEFIYTPDGIVPARYPLQELINLIKSEGGECFWHEARTREDIELYFGEEMLEEMRQSGLLYFARIRPCRAITEYSQPCEEFIAAEAAYYHVPKEVMEEQIFEYEECHPIYLFSKEERNPDMKDCAPDLLGGPRLRVSIIFSSIPIAAGRYQLLKPVLGELIKMEKRKAAAVERVRQEEQKQRELDQMKIRSMEAYFRSQGCNEEQIHEMLHPKGIMNGFRR